jgi:hypothetical protein
MSEREKFTVEVECDVGHIRTLLSFFAKVEELGETGEHEIVSLFVGDLKATFDHEYAFTIEEVPRGSIGYVYDAG